MALSPTGGEETDGARRERRSGGRRHGGGSSGDHVTASKIAHTCSGRRIRVSLHVDDPPAVSRLYIHDPPPRHRQPTMAGHLRPPTRRGRRRPPRLHPLPDPRPLCRPGLRRARTLSRRLLRLHRRRHRRLSPVAHAASPLLHRRLLRPGRGRILQAVPTPATTDHARREHRLPLLLWRRRPRVHGGGHQELPR
ncbi:uncharacterized protein [Oryza sativa Japonica Group]|uniref:cDNA clone:J013136B15, full insert sequence n=2 Tax=Oryza sativa subsp. japonica TaxID=39947 RepID=B7EES4_ORYSJ|nr:uncharacterized protein LOC9271557 [Oryza sativa Japonica Group]BAG90871.1 unnamed protein product [Oryza sativa Japonica Group]BAH90982.1 Os01g0239300 [Oryza sativa Japonica Group]|eukprot:NP_001172252.1 Os01g0239300 [Oryza sativa Japonica Group]